jgi:DNA-binding transcriptional MerR regulator
MGLAYDDGDHAPQSTTTGLACTSVHRGVRMGLEQLDDEHYPSLTVGQAAELLGVQPAFLRSLDAAGVITPSRSGGGHRRYSRYQLALAARIRDLFSNGHTMSSAQQVLGLEEDLRRAYEERDHAHLQRDEARIERDRAYLQRDEAREQRDQAYGQRDEAREQRNQAYRQLDEVREERDQAVRQRSTTG